jgi:hypothetical protein
MWGGDRTVEISLNANLPAWVAWPDALQKTEANQEIQGLKSKQRVSAGMKPGRLIQPWGEQ